MTLATMLALAANEPWCIPPDRAARLTIHQLANIVLAPERDSSGRVDTTPGLSSSDLAKFLGPAPGDDFGRDIFDVWVEANKVPRWRAEQLWRERCRTTR